jgi:hypothetical protein
MALAKPTAALSSAVAAHQPQQLVKSVKPADTVRDSAQWESVPERLTVNSVRYTRGKFLGKVCQLRVRWL